jgi:hypothetical protein
MKSGNAANLQAQAIFSLPSNTGSFVVMNTIPTRPGSSKMMAHFSWIWGERPVAGFTLTDVDVDPVRDCVRRLSSPPDGFGGRHTHRHGGWQIAVRHKVAWHFKLQAHGPQRSLRKLVRIDG